MCVHVHACARVCIHACARVCVCVCVSASWLKNCSIFELLLVRWSLFIMVTFGPEAIGTGSCYIYLRKAVSNTLVTMTVINR